MDVQFEKNGVNFVWNADKSVINLQKHGISFEQACAAFFDPFLKLVNASDNGQARDACIGYDDFGRLLFVVHIEIEAESIRLISARKATVTERNYYDF